MSRDRTYLLHIRDAVAKVEEYASHGRDAFLNDTRWQDSILRQF